MFGLDPFSRPVAIAEILLLLGLAAFIGWLLGRLVRSGRVSTLRSAVADKKAELENCRAELGSGRSSVDVVITKPDTTFVSEETQPEPVIETPQFFVSTDPLLPAYSHDDTPAPIIAEPLPSLDEPVTPIDETIPSISSTLEFPLIEEALLGKESPVIVTPAATTPAQDRETEVLNRIAARASELNFDRIGLAVASEADDLKDIVGVGPFLERKLHSLGIYTFRQIANFTKEDVHKVNEIVEFFPGRIERDNWVGQAKSFYERKYGKKS
ncbi:hypothetical protein [Spirosoma validum]|uniref:DUF4332 domain-containing protein n=1 Tax=Spirosoma validum TaxID=2771355 RepID=A0A927B2C1_9BACT|nr:hypothetical protein [Spirosoma validum]MBD2754294.1 hypothetical protein [Spirosoma validum]